MKKIIYFIMVMILVLPLWSQNQLEKWFIDPYVVDFTGSTVTLTDVTISDQRYYPTGGGGYHTGLMYDVGGNTEFFVSTNVFDGEARLVDMLMDAASTIPVNPSQSYPQSIIVPIPGGCREYYFIMPYFWSSGHGGELMVVYYRFSMNELSVFDLEFPNEDLYGSLMDFDWDYPDPNKDYSEFILIDNNTSVGIY